MDMRRSEAIRNDFPDGDPAGPADGLRPTLPEMEKIQSEFGITAPRGSKKTKDIDGLPSQSGCACHSKMNHARIFTNGPGAHAVKVYGRRNPLRDKCKCDRSHLSWALFSGFSWRGSFSDEKPKMDDGTFFDGRRITEAFADDNFDGRTESGLNIPTAIIIITNSIRTLMAGPT
jgi:hypothetical protein